MFECAESKCGCKKTTTSIQRGQISGWMSKCSMRWCRSGMQGCSGDGNHGIQDGGPHEVMVLMTAGRIAYID